MWDGIWSGKSGSDRDFRYVGCKGRDPGRGTGHGSALCFVDSIAKMIPNELNITIDRALQINPELRKLYEGDMQVHELIDMSRRLEGLPRHTSMHAAGVVICPEEADNFVPLSRGSDGSITTQFTMTTLEELGLLKMDFLGLRTLTVIKKALDLIEKDTGKKIDIDAIDYEDKAVLDSLGTGKTDGVFQLESGGMKNFMKELKPQSLEDIIAGISLYRPGPMDFIPKYIRGKINTEPSPIPARSSSLSWSLLTAASSTRSRSCRSSGIWAATPWPQRPGTQGHEQKEAGCEEKERNNFVYGNPEEGVPGCIGRGIRNRWDCRFTGK